MSFFYLSLSLSLFSWLRRETKRLWQTCDGHLVGCLFAWLRLKASSWPISAVKQRRIIDCFSKAVRCQVTNMGFVCHLPDVSCRDHRSYSLWWTIQHEYAIRGSYPSRTKETRSEISATLDQLLTRVSRLCAVFFSRWFWANLLTNEYYITSVVHSDERGEKEKNSFLHLFFDLYTNMKDNLSLSGRE